MIDYPEDEFWFSDVVADPEDDENVPPEHAVALEDYGITADEERHPEPLSAHLRREIPDPRDDAGSAGGEDADSDEYRSDPEEDPEVIAEHAMIEEFFERRRP